MRVSGSFKLKNNVSVNLRVFGQDMRDAPSFAASYATAKSSAFTLVGGKARRLNRQCFPTALSRPRIKTTARQIEIFSIFIVFGILFLS